MSYYEKLEDGNWFVGSLDRKQGMIFSPYQVTEEQIKSKGHEKFSGAIFTRCNSWAPRDPPTPYMPVAG